MAENKKKMFRLHMIRRAIQILMFLFFPGIFTTVFYALKTVYTNIIKYNFSMETVGSSVLILIGVIFITVIFGRFFCGYLCSFGAMEDLLWFLSKNTIKLKWKMPQKIDHGMKYIKYAVLALIMIVFWTFQYQVADSEISPWAVFGMYTRVSGWSSPKTLISIGGALLLIIMIASIFIERFFCRYLCPLGAIFSIISCKRPFSIKKERSQCKNCRVCTNNCTMGIPLYEMDKVTSGECIQCFSCMEACPRENISANPKPAVATAISVASLTGVVYLGTLPKSQNDEVMSNIEQSQKGKYSDGTYNGTGTGFRGDTEVSVEVENGNISTITVVSYKDDEQYFNQAKNTIISNIIKTQSTDVATVSGATFSSKGIIAAVENALEKNDVKTIEKADGTYTGTGTGFRGDTEVSVTVKDKKITDITIVSYVDDEKFFSRAKDTVISEIISNQSVDVDSVSGATFSSNGIKEAVAKALEVEYTNPNDSQMSQEGNHYGGGKGKRFR